MRERGRRTRKGELRKEAGRVVQIGDIPSRADDERAQFEFQDSDATARPGRRWRAPIQAVRE